MHEHATSATVDGPVPPVSAAAVARAAGVSSAAVSYVLNGKGGVSPGDPAPHHPRGERARLQAP